MTSSGGGTGTGTGAPAPEIRTVPDPSTLTTDQLLREIARLEKLNEQASGSIKELLFAQIKGLSDLTTEKFRSMAELAALTERQRIERKEDDRISLNAALAAAEKAVTANNEAVDKANLKTERSTADQLSQLSASNAVALAATTASVQALQTRVEKIENVKQGGKETVTAVYAFAGFLVTLLILGGFLAAAGVFQ